MDSLVEFRNVSLFINDHLVLSDVEFTVSKGELVYLIGKVGSGKSTLIKSINAELPIAEGEAEVSGYTLGNIKIRQIPYFRRKLGIVFQDFQLLSDRTVNENLEFVLRATGWKKKNEIQERIAEVLEKVGLGFKGYKMPHQLSGGEQQRVVIARALLNNPEIILADEPTGNLDPQTSESILQLLMDISRTGRAVILATHNYNLLKKYPSRILKCADGKLIETDINDLEIEFLAKYYS
jgi:cell division transport system ATP-binding protein